MADMTFDTRLFFLAFFFLCSKNNDKGDTYEFVCWTMEFRAVCSSRFGSELGYSGMSSSLMRRICGLFTTFLRWSINKPVLSVGSP